MRKYKEAGAEISECGLYRYRLWRWWAEAPPMCFVMLNPSTADGEVDDPTIRRCVGFAEREGYGGIFVVNLFALRASKPDRLLNAHSPLNDEAALAFFVSEITACAKNGCVVAGWGGHPAVRRLGSQMIDLARKSAAEGHTLAGRGARALDCLGMTKDGDPRHPLYLSGTAHLLPWIRTDKGATP